MDRTAPTPGGVTRRTAIRLSAATAGLALGSLAAGRLGSPSGEAAADEAASTVRVYRLYNASTGEHLYTKSATEVSKCVDAGWVYEGLGWIAPAEGDEVYRLYNPNSGDHLYTMSATEVAKCVALGWRDEGVCLCSQEGGAVSVYRLFNPNETVGTHLFTTSSTEVEKCVAAGWEDEGLCLLGTVASGWVVIDGAYYYYDEADADDDSLSAQAASSSAFEGLDVDDGSEDDGGDGEDAGPVAVDEGDADPAEAGIADLEAGESGADGSSAADGDAADASGDDAGVDDEEDADAEDVSDDAVDGDDASASLSAASVLSAALSAVAAPAYADEESSSVSYVARTGWLTTSDNPLSTSTSSHAYWLAEGTGKLAVSRLVTESEIGYWAYATKYGWMATGKHTATSGYVYLAYSTGELRPTGWLVTSDYSSSGGLQRYYIDPTYHACIPGYSTAGYAHYTTSSGYVLTNGYKKINGTWYYADNDGLLSACTNSTMIAMMNKAQSYSSSTSYLMLVNSTTNKTAIFTGSKGDWSLLKYWTCSTGASSTPTKKGTFKIGSRGYSFGSGYTCYYWTQFTGSYLFHSIKYYQGTRTVLDGTLGANVSHGCVRLAIENAKWIYDYIPKNTTVVSYA